MVRMTRLVLGLVIQIVAHAQWVRYQPHRQPGHLQQAQHRAESVSPQVHHLQPQLRLLLAERKTVAVLKSAIAAREIVREMVVVLK